MHLGSLVEAPDHNITWMSCDAHGPTSGEHSVYRCCGTEQMHMDTQHPPHCSKPHQCQEMTCTPD